MESSYDVFYKVIVLGDSGVGKSNLIMRFIQRQFIEKTIPTIGVEFYTRNINIDKNTIAKIQLWDTAGQERYRAITGAYYRGAIGALIVYDITKYKTFENINKWLSEIAEHSTQKVKIILVGNKIDISVSREVSTDVAKKFAEEKSIMFIETSALDTTNVELAFQNLAEEISNTPKKTQIYEDIIEISEPILIKSKSIKTCHC